MLLERSGRRLARLCKEIILFPALLGVVESREGLEDLSATGYRTDGI
jgi:hypothetical protein